MPEYKKWTKENYEGIPEGLYLTSENIWGKLVLILSGYAGWEDTDRLNTKYYDGPIEVPLEYVWVNFNELYGPISIITKKEHFFGDANIEHWLPHLISR
jgi:hypothetical protein